MKKITIILVLGFLLLFGSNAGAQFATLMDSSDVAGWKFTTFTDVDDSLKNGYQIYQKIDTTTATVPKSDDVDTTGTDIAAAIANCYAADDTVDTYREAVGDTIQDHWAAFTAGGDPGAEIHDSLYANTPGYLVQVDSPDDIEAGTPTDEYYLTYEATGDSFEWVSLPGGGDANKSDIHDTTAAHWDEWVHVSGDAMTGNLTLDSGLYIGLSPGNTAAIHFFDVVASPAMELVGYVGIGDDTPDFPLEIEFSYAPAQFAISESDGGPNVTIGSSSGDLMFTASGGDVYFSDENLATTGTFTSPLIIGGTATTSDLSLKTTSGIGATGADMHFLVGNNGATKAMTILNNGKVGLGTDSTSSILHIKANTPGEVGSHQAGQLIIQNPANSVYANAVITGYESDAGGNPDQQLWYLGGSSGGNSDVTLLNRRNSKLHLGANGVTKMTIVGDGNVGIGIMSPPERLSVVGNIATGDSTTGDVDVYHYFSTDASWTTEYLKWDDGLGEFQFSDDLTVTGNAYHVTSTEADSQFMSKKYIDDAAGGLTAQSVKGDHVDSTSEDFVFDDAYHVTSGEADSAYLTHGGAAATYVTATLTEEEVEDFVGGMLGGTETNITVTYEDASNDIDFVVDSEPWDSTTAWGNLINVHQDSIVSWANLVNAATDTIGDWTSLVNEAKDSLTAWANKVNDILPLTKGFTIQTPTTDHDFPLGWMTPVPITVVAVSGVCIDGTNVVGCLMEYDNDAANPTVCNSSDWTFTTGEERTTDLSNASIDAGDWVGWKTTSVSGEVSFLSITIEYTQP